MLEDLGPQGIAALPRLLEAVSERRRDRNLTNAQVRALGSILRGTRRAVPEIDNALRRRTVDLLPAGRALAQIGYCNEEFLSRLVEHARNPYIKHTELAETLAILHELGGAWD